MLGKRRVHKMRRRVRMEVDEEEEDPEEEI